jgi:hypothetical protein
MKKYHPNRTKKRTPRHKHKHRHRHSKHSKHKHSKHKHTHKHTHKRKLSSLRLKNRTPQDVKILSEDIAGQLNNKLPSYSPTINDLLISLKSIPRETLTDCNNKQAFLLKEPLQISVSDRCVPYDTAPAKHLLLKNLSANKHIDVNKIVPPKQISSNCWFNAMFVTLFVSDKGRKFFHYFRQLMIEGRQADGQNIPKALRDAFALLNFAVESALLGTKYAYELDTNNIIKHIYNNIPESYHKLAPYLVSVDEASNPIRYYGSIINYLDNKAIELIFVQDVNVNVGWRDQTMVEMKKANHVPHIIVLEIYDEPSGKITDKPTQFTMNGTSYVLDSCVVRDIQKQHFCATIMCEGKEMAYDGMSFHRLVPMDWVNKINTDFKWSFEGSNNYDGSPLEWNFAQGYQMLIYYRV